MALQVLMGIFGLVAGIMAVNGGIIGPYGVAWIGAAVGIVLVLILVVTAVVTDRKDPTRPLVPPEVTSLVGQLGIAAITFMIGALIHLRLWNQYWAYVKDPNGNAPYNLLTLALFGLGVILGFFLVRNWHQEQKDFITNLVAIFGSAFIATLVGPLANLDKVWSLASYGTGFVLSGALNLIAAALLEAHYVNSRSVKSRALLDFFYGSERAKAVDEYFLRSFEEDKDYAKRLLRNAAAKYAALVRTQYAALLEERRAARVAQATQKFFYYRLVSMRRLPSADPDAAITDKSRPFEHTLEYAPVEAIGPEMVRVSVAVRWQDQLEYLIAPGEFKGSFAVANTVAGLAVKARETIVMARDHRKLFRTKEYPEGRTPDEASTRRGFQEIDFLSYISIPIIARVGSPDEVELGVVNVDSLLFVTEAALTGDVVVVQPANKAKSDHAETSTPASASATRWTIDQLQDYASRLYEENDAAVAHVEQLTEPLVPVLELYLKCRIGGA